MPHSPGHIALLLSTLLIAACSKPPAPTPTVEAAATTDNKPVADTMQPAGSTTIATVDEALLGAQHWRLQDASDAQGRRIDALLVRPEQPIQFNLAGGRISVTNACNGMSGAYQLLGDEVRIGTLAGTKMACVDPAISNLDNAIGKRLQGSARIALQPGTPPRMEWRTADGDVLRFIGAATADTRYGGPGKTMFIEVAAQTKPCQSPSMSRTIDCLQVREVHYDEQGVRTGAQGPWQPFPGSIEGYTHEQNIRTVLRVKRYPISGAKLDQPQVAYVLEMQIESENVTP